MPDMPVYQYQYARLAKPRTLKEYVEVPVRNARGIYEGLHNKQISNYDVYELKNTMNKGGGAVMALLSTINTVPRVLGAPHLMAILSWLGAFSFGENILNWFIWLRTSINLNQQYISSEGERYPIAEDPRAIPFHLLDKDTINHIGDRLEIPYTLDRPARVKEKFQQTAIQAKTWWLISSGVLVPSGAFWLFDKLNDPLHAAFYGVKNWLHMHIGFRLASNDDAMARQAKIVARSLAAPKGQSMANRRFKRLENEIFRVLQVHKLFRGKSIHKMTEEQLLDALGTHLSEMTKTEKGRQRLRNLSVFVDEKLYELGHPISKFNKNMSLLNTHANSNDAAKAITEGVRYININLFKRTLFFAQYSNFFTQLADRKVRSDSKHVKFLLNNYSTYQLLRYGKAGRRERIRRLYNFMGNAPEKFTEEMLRFNESWHTDPLREKLLGAIRRYGSTRRWRILNNRFLFGGAVLATAAYLSFVLGHDFESHRHKGGRGAGS